MKSICDLIFPPFCSGCNEPLVTLCADCLAQLRLCERAMCATCLRTSDLPFCSRACAHALSALDGIFTLGRYHEHPLIARLISSLKFQGNLRLAQSLGTLMAERIIESGRLAEHEEHSTLDITAVPLHRTRLRRRGYNQSAVLAAALGAKLNLPVETLLTRTRNTKPQTTLRRAERLTNLVHAFSCTPSSDALYNRSVLLVDDVATTGATLDEAAQTLKRAGAARVWGCVIARTDPELL